MNDVVLFQQLLGATFASLPPTLYRLHDGREKLLSGRCEVRRGNNLLAQLFAAIGRLPAAGQDQLIRVKISKAPGGERWTRTFGNKKMCSTLRCADGLLVEQLGPLHFAFKLNYNVSQRTISWQLIGVRILGVPAPLSWFSNVTASESECSGRYQFEVRAALPVIGLLVHYSGWLDV